MQEEQLLIRGELPCKFIVNKKGKIEERIPIKVDVEFLEHRWMESYYIRRMGEECTDIVHLRLLIFEFCEMYDLTNELPQDLIDEISMIGLFI